MKKLLYILLFSLCCILTSCSSVNDEDPEPESGQRLAEIEIALSTESEIYEFKYNSQGNLESYKEQASSPSVHHKFFYKDNKLAGTNCLIYYGNTGQLLMTMDEEIIYHTSDTILVKIELDKDETDAATLIDTLIIDPTRGYLLKRHCSSIQFAGIDRNEIIRTYTYDNAGNMLTERKEGWGDDKGADYTYDSKFSPFSTLKGIPHWYWTYFDVCYPGNSIYSGTNNRINETIYKSHTEDPYNFVNQYEYDNSKYSIKKSGAGVNTLKYTYEEY